MNESECIYPETERSASEALNDICPLRPVMLPVYACQTGRACSKLRSLYQMGWVANRLFPHCITQASVESHCFPRHMPSLIITNQFFCTHLARHLNLLTSHHSTLASGTAANTACPSRLLGVLIFHQQVSFLIESMWLLFSDSDDRENRGSLLKDCVHLLKRAVCCFWTLEEVSKLRSDDEASNT